MRSTLFPLAATLAVQVLVSMAVVTVPVLAPAVAAETGVSAGDVGIFIALVYGASMATRLVSGPLVQRFGAIRLSQACLVACAAGLACVATGAPALFVVGALFLGAGYGPVTPASSHILARSTPPQRLPLVFSLKQTGVPLGGALAGAVVGEWMMDRSYATFRTLRLQCAKNGFLMGLVQRSLKLDSSDFLFGVCKSRTDVCSTGCSAE